jgi:hypothetical protein
MTNPTLERAARAVCELHGGDYWDKAANYERDRYFDVARAVLMAVREPDEATRWRMAESCTGDTIHDTHFTAMIDAILAEGE